MASGITNITYAKDKMIAGYLAQEGIEYMRNLRDNDALFTSTTNTTWTTFTNAMTTSTSPNSICTSANPCGFNSSSMPISIFNCGSDPSSGNNCKLYLTNGVYNDSSSSGAYSGFTRKIWMTLSTGVNGANEAIITSAVYWQQGSILTNITLSDDLYSWE